jgi:hypothetical protein
MDKIMHKAGVKPEEMVAHPEPVKPPPIIVGILIYKRRRRLKKRCEDGV